MALKGQFDLLGVLGLHLGDEVAGPTDVVVVVVVGLPDLDLEGLVGVAVESECLAGPIGELASLVADVGLVAHTTDV